MDFINKAAAQVTDLFKSMTPGARLTAGMLLILIVVSVAYLFNHQMASSDAFLMGGEAFPASQLPAMEAAFDKAGLHTYEIVGNRVRVPRGQQAAFMGAMADAGALPPDFGKYLEKAVDSGPFVSKEQQRQRTKHAKEQELALIIRSMRGIEKAAVLYDVQEKRGFGEESIVTASVNVKPVGTQMLDDERVEMVRHAVASAIAGLKPNSVTVIDLNGRHHAADSESSGGGGGGSSPDRYTRIKKTHEENWEARIRKALSYVPGVEVSANVELEIETRHTESTTKYDPKGVVYKQGEQSRNRSSESGAPGGRPGLSAQGGVANNSAKIGSGEGNKTTEEDTRSDTMIAVPTTQLSIEQHPLTPKRVSVAISIPSSYYQQIWNERNPPAEGQPPKKPADNEIAEIENKVKVDLENAVIQLLPAPGNSIDPFPRVKITTFQSLAVAPIAATPMQELAMAWLTQHWSTVAMVGLALVSLVMLRSMVRAMPAPAPPAAAASGDDAASPALNLVADDEAEPADGEKAAPKSRLKRRGPGGPSLRDELSDIVRDDPEAAVSILRTWIGNAA